MFTFFSGFLGFLLLSTAFTFPHLHGEKRKRILYCLTPLKQHFSRNTLNNDYMITVIGIFTEIVLILSYLPLTLPSKTYKKRSSIYFIDGLVGKIFSIKRLHSTIVRETLDNPKQLNIFVLHKYLTHGYYTTFGYS